MVSKLPPSPPKQIIMIGRKKRDLPPVSFCSRRFPISMQYVHTILRSFLVIYTKPHPPKIKLIVVSAPAVTIAPNLVRAARPTSNLSKRLKKNINNEYKFTPSPPRPSVRLVHPNLAHKPTVAPVDPFPPRSPGTSTRMPLR